MSPDRAKALLQHTYPQRLLCGLMHRATRIRFRPWKNWQIRWFIRRYGVDMSEALLSDTTRYPDFNSFFTRALRPETRPVDEAVDALISPADGTVGHFGVIRDDLLIQAKGLEYSLARLLRVSGGECAEFDGGRFLTVYLAPGNYHRVHMPLDGVLRKTVHVPGRLFSVGETTTRWIPNLFARNERVVSIFDNERGPIAIVMVGALFVGGIEQVWDSPVESSRGQGSGPADRGTRSHAPTLGKGQEMGRFNMGSTVVALFGPSLRPDWAPGLRTGQNIRFGERVATLGAPAQRCPDSRSRTGPVAEKA